MVKFVRHSEDEDARSKKKLANFGCLVRVPVELQRDGFAQQRFFIIGARLVTLLKPHVSVIQPLEIQQAIRGGQLGVESIRREPQAFFERRQRSFKVSLLVQANP